MTTSTRNCVPTWPAVINPSGERMEYVEDSQKHRSPSILGNVRTCTHRMEAAMVSLPSSLPLCMVGARNTRSRLKMEYTMGAHVTVFGARLNPRSCPLSLTHALAEMVLV